MSFWMAACNIDVPGGQLIRLLLMVKTIFSKRQTPFNLEWNGGIVE
jgi:hypothetical protein